MGGTKNGEIRHPGRVRWDLPDAPQLTAALHDAGFELASEGAVVIISADMDGVTSSGVFGPRHIVVLPPEASAAPALEAGAFRVLRAPVEPDSLVVQVQRATTDWHRARRMVLHAAIVDRVSDLIVAIDATGCISYANSAAQRCLSTSDVSLIGQEVDLVLDGASGASENEPVQYQIEQDGETMWIQGAWHPVREPQGQAIARLLVARDVTREHSLRRDLVRSGALAELGMLAAEVAHEVNNPATYLMTNLSILRDDAQDHSRRSPAGERG